MWGRNKRGFLADVEALRLRVSRAAREKGARTVALVGLGSKVGASTLAVWLARSLAAEGRRVVLVDASSTRARLHAPLALEPSPGVGEWLATGAEPEGAVRSTGLERFDLLPVGELPTDASRRSAGSWRAVLDALSERYDLVLVDAGRAESPATLEVGAACDVSIGVSMASRMRREAIQGRLAALRAHGAEVLGLVLNRRRYSIPEFIYRRL